MNDGLAAAVVDAAAEQRWNDNALAQPVPAPTLRLWRYARPAVVLGRSQRAWLDGAASAAAPPLVARAAGGGAVLAGPWLLGLSVLLPPSHAPIGDGPVAAYRWLGEGIAHALQVAGVSGAVALSPHVLRSRQPEHMAPDWACFGGLSPWEVAVGARKIAGLAQVRRRHGVLLVAGVLLDDSPWALLCRALHRGEGESERLRRATTSCAAHGARADAVTAALADALTRALAAVPGAGVTALTPSALAG